MVELVEKRCWIFDMDGTLTLGIHDFDAIRVELGLPLGVGILEALDRLPPAEAAPLRRRLLEIEREVARASKAAPDAALLVEHLSNAGVRLGVLTRNALELAHLTLESVGLRHHFDDEVILGRECAAPKPSPEGVLRIISQWEADPGDVVMVGDDINDLLAGKAAGADVVLIDRMGHGRWRGIADRVVSRLDALI